MSHDIDDSTGQPAMAYVGAEPWHGLGEKLPQGQSIDAWKRAARLDWTIQMVPVQYQFEGRTRTMPERFVLTRDDTGAALSVVSGGAPSRQRKERIQSSLLGKDDGEIRCARVIRVGFLISKGEDRKRSINRVLARVSQLREASFGMDAFEDVEMLGDSAVEVDTAQLRKVTQSSYGIFAGQPIAWAVTRHPYATCWTSTTTPCGCAKLPFYVMCLHHRNLKRLDTAIRFSNESITGEDDGSNTNHS